MILATHFRRLIAVVALVAFHHIGVRPSPFGESHPLQSLIFGFFTLMSPSALLPFVEKFPHVSPEERALLLEWARTTPLLYGAWKPFKKLFKTVEAALNDGEIDIELLGVLLKRVDEAAFTQSSTRWKAVESTQVGGKPKSVSGNGFTYTVRQRDLWYENSGCRLVISSDEKKGLISALRKTLG